MWKIFSNFVAFSEYPNFKYNTMDCNFDGGDCCLENSNGEAVSSQEFCIDCICYEKPKVLSNCLVSEYVNNSVCEDFANVRECAFDGGKAYKKIK